jgi:hypothetical protein
MVHSLFVALMAAITTVAVADVDVDGEILEFALPRSTRPVNALLACVQTVLDAEDAQRAKIFIELFRLSIDRIDGCPTPTGTPCPFLPQVPMPGSSARSLPTILTRVSASGPLPISIAPLHRSTEPAVLDQIGLGAGEHELAARDVDLPAAKGFGEQAALHAGQDLGRVMRAGRMIVLVMRGIGMWA